MSCWYSPWWLGLIVASLLVFAILALIACAVFEDKDDWF